MATRKIKTPKHSPEEERAEAWERGVLTRNRSGYVVYVHHWDGEEEHGHAPGNPTDAGAPPAE